MIDVYVTITKIKFTRRNENGAKGLCSCYRRLYTKGIEFMVHIGMDTVEMNGKGFEMIVPAGQKVVHGTVLMRFDMKEIRRAGHPVTSAFVITNGSQLSCINLKTGIACSRAEVIGTVKNKREG